MTILQSAATGQQRRKDADSQRQVFILTQVWCGVKWLLQIIFGGNFPYLDFV